LQHCSTSATSLCTAKYIREYFRDGKLPPADAVCEVEDEFFPADQITQGDDLLNEADRSLLAAMRELSDSFEVPRMY
jgi:hypothetical protein